MQRRRLVHIALALAITTSLSIAASARPAHASTYTPRVAPGSFGVADLGLLTMPSSQRLPLLAALKNAGVDVVRADASWLDLEPNPPDLVSGAHSYKWSGFYNDGYNLDAFITDLANNGIRWEALPDNTPYWAGACGQAEPSATHWSDFAAFVGAIAQRYGNRGTFWAQHPTVPAMPVQIYEIWNEESSGAPCAGGWLPQDYDVVFHLTRAQIKAADPTAKVVVGGLADRANPGPWAQEMVAADPTIVQDVDGWGLHPYAHTAAAWISEPETAVVAFRQALEEVGVPDSQGIYVTEIGWPTSGTAGVYQAIPDSGTAPDRADALVRTTDDFMRSNCNVAEYIVYSWYTSEADANIQEDWFGIVNHDATLKASAQAWSNEVQLLNGNGPTPPPSGTVNLCTPPLVSVP